MTNAEYVIQSVQEIVEGYKEYVKEYGEITENEPEYMWWTNEYGTDLTEEIDCPHYSMNQCLNKKRQCKYGSSGWNDGCAECKARWLMEEVGE